MKKVLLDEEKVIHIEKPVVEIKLPKLVSIVPLKDHVIKQNYYFYDLKKGEEIQVADVFIETLKTENVIN